MTKISIIGIGDDGLQAVSPAVSKRIEEAQVLLGPERALDLLPTSVSGERVLLSGDLAELADQIRKVGDRAAVVLVFGDPMFYGLARYITDEFSKDQFEVIPHVSSMQLAFARVMESWDEAFLTNLANHSIDSVIEKCRIADKVGLFTTAEVGPSEVAKSLLAKQIDYFDAYVCENLGARNERVTRGSLEDIAQQTFEPLNVMILVRQRELPDRPREAVGKRLFGNPDEAFIQSRPKYGLITPAEVRSLALAQMDIWRDSIVWDVGAGSGSVSIEAAQLATEGTVYAIEMDPEDHQLIKANSKRFNVANVLPIQGQAPEAWEALPDPDCVFISGGGREVCRIAEAAYARLRQSGRLVVNLVSIDNLTELTTALRAKNDGVQVWMVNISRGTEQLERLTFDALNPSFLIAVTK
ncbi:precorrin-6y C5,15-methyltransferase (decarboxylating) subunit CbiE [Aeoliella mucimassa]|uniref:Precorrin-6Y C(5,15)-methyltransferase [decarboxylating] n=1 Tax=Aeoliella mucimassa TaxID=2527972 RepID=A0A518AT88_9BACT|nr:precorrin-6y C5,15-methyltransferase (decarboxylating) subunit CbiE [Aeoliella mucimassa]QDU57943.1 Precorrin-6Y C(5,15)-methyltransferase [decarboxylating] [Aeoliella mucimassa]